MLKRRFDTLYRGINRIYGLNCFIDKLNGLNKIMFGMIRQVDASVLIYKSPLMLLFLLEIHFFWCQPQHMSFAELCLHNETPVMFACALEYLHAYISCPLL